MADGVDWMLIGGGPSRDQVRVGWPWGRRCLRVGATNGGIKEAMMIDVVPALIWLSDQTAIDAYRYRSQRFQGQGSHVLTARGACPWADENIPIERDRATTYQPDRWGACRFSGLMLMQYVLNRSARPLRLWLAGYDGYGDQWDAALIRPWMESVERLPGVEVAYAAPPRWRDA